MRRVFTNRNLSVIPHSLSLATPSSRLFVWSLLSVGIFFLPISTLAGLSIWNRVGLDWAPSIGLTRAYHYVLHGDLGAAYDQNKLIFVVLAIGVPLLVHDLYELSRQKSSKSIQ